MEVQKFDSSSVRNVEYVAARPSSGQPAEPGEPSDQPGLPRRIRMVRFEQSVVINRSSEPVFEFLADPENDPQWSSASDEMRKTSRGPVGLGATFKQVGRFLGRRLEFSLEVTAYEPNRRFRMKVTAGPIRFAGMRVLETVPKTAPVSPSRVAGGRAASSESRSRFSRERRRGS
jgi:hypothetical protein